MMKHTGRRQANSAIWTVLQGAAAFAAAAGALYFVGAFIYVALSRIGYPFALEWLEGGSYAQVHRLLTGQPLYEQPSMEYVAMLYPPLYYYAAAVISRAVGFGFLPLRLLSFASSLGAMVVIFLIVRPQGGSHLPALLASGFFAAAYHLSGSWFDIARVDMLSVFLVLLSIWLLGHHHRAWHAIAGLTFAAACLTKQTHLITFACLLIYLTFIARYKLLTFLLPCIAVLGISYIALDRLYDGWFGFFVLRLALGSGEYVTFDPGTFVETALGFWLNSILLALPVVVLVIAFFAIAGLRSGADRSRTLFHLAYALGMIGTSWSVVQVGGYKNDLVPAYAGIAVLFGLALQRLLEQRQSIRVGALLALCTFQFALLWYPIPPQLPSQKDLVAGRALVQQVRTQTGDVYLPFHPEIALMGGKRPFASWSAMYQLEGNYGGGDVRLAGRVKTEFMRAMERRQFSLIILDQEPNWIWGDPERHYSRVEGPVFPDEDVFWPVTGWQTRPELILVPNAE